MSITTPDWVKDAIFYQIFPDRFAKSGRFGKNGYLPKPKNLQPWGATPTFHGFQGGDLLGVIDKLPYLEDLGVNAIYFNPSSPLPRIIATTPMIITMWIPFWAAIKL